MQEHTSLPVCRLYRDSIVLYNIPDGHFVRSKAHKETEKNLTRGNYNGYMSPKTRSKVKKYLSTWFEAIETCRANKDNLKFDKVPYLTFVTTTLPAEQCHEDNEIKRTCLTPFIETLKRKFNVKNYFWRAESQKNGNIHFHILIDSWVHHARIREEWNKCINKLGYVDRFEMKHKHDNPNSTDIHSLRNIRNIEAYIIKYVSKSDGHRPIKGRIHGCSDDLKTLSPYECFIDSNIDVLIAAAIDDDRNKAIIEDNYTVIFCDTRTLLKAHLPHKSIEMQNYFLSVADQLYNDTPPLPHEPQPAKPETTLPTYIQTDLFPYLGR